MGCQSSRLGHEQEIIRNKKTDGYIVSHEAQASRGYEAREKEKITSQKNSEEVVIMVVARLVIPVEHFPLAPIDLLAENITRNLVGYGLTCGKSSISNISVSSNLSIAPRTSDDVIVIARIAWQDEHRAPTIVAS